MIEIVERFSPYSNVTSLFGNRHMLFFSYTAEKLSIFDDTYRLQRCDILKFAFSWNDSWRWFKWQNKRLNWYSINMVIIPLRLNAFDAYIYGME